jgi:hypothetical protein
MSIHFLTNLSASTLASATRGSASFVAINGSHHATKKGGPDLSGSPFRLRTAKNRPILNTCRRIHPDRRRLAPSCLRACRR